MDDRFASIISRINAISVPLQLHAPLLPRAPVQCNAIGDQLCTLVYEATAAVLKDVRNRTHPVVLSLRIRSPASARVLAVLQEGPSSVPGPSAGTRSSGILLSTSNGRFAPKTQAHGKQQRKRGTPEKRGVQPKPKQGAAAVGQGKRRLASQKEDAKQEEKALPTVGTQRNRGFQKKATKAVEKEESLGSAHRRPGPRKNSANAKQQEQGASKRQSINRQHNTKKTEHTEVKEEDNDELREWQGPRCPRGRQQRTAKRQVEDNDDDNCTQWQSPMAS